MICRTKSPRRGTVLPLVAVSCTAMFGFIALAIDLGMLTIARTECQAAADGAALTGCRILSNKSTVEKNDGVNAMIAARTTATSNNLRTKAFVNADISRIRLGVYDYNSGTSQFDKPTVWSTNYTPGTATGDPDPGTPPTGKSWTAIEVQISVSQPTFFAQVFGVTSMPTSASAVAVHRPRDVAFVLDFSGSMQFGSMPTWPVNFNANAAVVGLNSPDPHYPKFGHYGRYSYYNNTPDTASYNTAASDPTSRPNPFQNKSSHSNSGYSYAPSNHTMESRGGPPIADSFWTASDGASSVTSSTPYVKAFTWDPPVSTLADTTTLTPAVYDFSDYLTTTATGIATPAPPSCDSQSGTPMAYRGDKWPRTNGGLGYDSTVAGGEWSTLASSTFTDNWAKTLKEFLGNPALTTADSDGTVGIDGRRIRTTGTTERFDFSTINTTTYGAPPANDTRDGGNLDTNYRDRIWEQYGYDLDVKAMKTELAKASNLTRNITLRSGTIFQGYSMGPGYWGKTFFIWPPDPRWGAPGSPGTSTAGDPTSPDTTSLVKDTSGNWICDWRRRFFLDGDGTAFNPQSDNINQVMFRTSAGHVFNSIVTTGTAGSTAGYFEINYAAILKWIKTGPQVFPSNLRAGRLVYYKSIPDDCNISGDATTDDNMDKRFWREYIHFVLGVGSFNTTTYPVTTPPAANPTWALASTEANFGLTLSVTAAAAFDPNGTNTPAANPKPYMTWTNSVNRPRAHMWFGPLTMTHFISYGGTAIRPWNAGTLREAQCWQLKAAMSSVLDDMRTNHPNDFCGTAYFADRSEFNTPRAPMGQDWYTLRNALYFRRDVVDVLKQFPNDSVEHRPYNSSFAGTNTDMIPNSKGSTDPNTGFAVAYNLLSSSTGLTQWTTTSSPSGNTATNVPIYGNRGRRGASKIVVFETDGVPNTTRTWRYTGSGVNTYFSTSTGTTPSTTGVSSINSQAVAALAIVKMIVANDTASPPGFSYPNTKARVYAMGFGDLFEGWPTIGNMTTEGQNAHTFLLDVQQMGNTSSSSDTALPTVNIITGPYQRPNPNAAISGSNPAGRIEKLRDALERIMQSGVQVTLIE